MWKSIMRGLFLLAATATVGFLLTNVMNTSNLTGVKAATSVGPVVEPDDTNILLANWDGPFGGVPPFDRVQVSQFKPALEAGMAENLREVDQIAGNSAAPTFDNTIAALERAGRTLDRVTTIYGVWGSTMNGPEFQAIQREMAPRLSAFNDKITQNDALFKRIKAVYESNEKLTPEQKRLSWLYYTNFVRAGAQLSPEAKTRLSQINQKLAGLFTKFSQNTLAEESEQILVLKTEADLAGLPQSVRDAAAEAATTKKMPGVWVISNTRSSIDPFLTYSESRPLREKAWRMFINRGDNGDERDNNTTITEILQLRAERAALLGFPTHAHWRLQNSMAKTPERAMELMEAVWKPAVARVHEEVADMQKLADKEGAKITIEPWDYRYYAEKVRKERYDLDQNEVKQYLQLEKLREGVFWVAGSSSTLSSRPPRRFPSHIRTFASGK